MRAASASRTSDRRSSLPEGTEHVVVTAQPDASAPEYRCPATRLQEYDDVDLADHVADDEDPETVTVLFEPGDELPLPLARDGTYRAHSGMFACFDADGNRLDGGQGAGTNEGVRKWQASSD